jgi:catechol 2,3-dioxygenase-like lactoylglutathione lyase family enzyme
MSRPRMTVSGVVLDSPDAQALARFYEELLGWKRTQDEPDWVKLSGPDGGTGLSFQTESSYVRPTWPAGPDGQQMQVHLDIHVDDLDVAGTYAASIGAQLADFQPQDDVRVYLDPVGHPFCLFLDLG